MAREVNLQVKQSLSPKDVVKVLADEVDRLRYENGILLSQIAMWTERGQNGDGTIVSAAKGERLLVLDGRVVKMGATLDVLKYD